MIGGEVQAKKWMASDSVRSLGATKFRKPYKKQTHNHVCKQYASHPYQTSLSTTSWNLMKILNVIFGGMKWKRRSGKRYGIWR